MRSSRSSGGIPERITRARRGPMPLTPISFSNSAFSRSVQKPKRAMPSSRMWVWMNRRIGSLAPLLDLVPGGERDVDLVAHPLHVEEQALRVGPEQGALEIADHGGIVERRGGHGGRPGPRLACLVGGAMPS